MIRGILNWWELFKFRQRYTSPFKRICVWLLVFLFFVSLVSLLPQLLRAAWCVFSFLGWSTAPSTSVNSLMAVCDSIGESKLFALLGLTASVVSLLRDAFAPFLPGDQMVDRIVHRNTASREWSRHRLFLSKHEEDMGFVVDAPVGANEKDTIESIVYSPRFDSCLLANMPILVHIKSDRMLALSIRRRLWWFAELLAYRQRIPQRRRFANEDKVVIATPFAEWKIENGERCEFGIVRSCYYASYLSNEMHRDDIYTVMRSEPDRLAHDEFEPYWEDESKHWHLPDFDPSRSLHVGVNTIARTKDGCLCFWIQQEGADGESDCTVAPTGSGSMDWNDLKCVAGDLKDGIEFRSAIIHAVERELLEESIKESSDRKKVKAGLQTRIIGYYRLCARGGIPGFLCMTKIPMTYNEFLSMKGADCKDREEVARDNRTVRRIEFSGQWQTQLGNMLDEIIRNNQFDGANSVLRLSLPLRACLMSFRRALQNDEFCKWFEKSE